MGTVMLVLAWVFVMAALIDISRYLHKILNRLNEYDL